jgi:cell division protein FtsB
MVPLYVPGRRSMKSPLVRVAYLIVFLLVASYAFVALRGANGIHAWRDKQQAITELERKNAALAREIERKKDHIQRLSSSPDQQELEIRDRLKLIHPGEKVFILGDPQKK